MTHQPPVYSPITLRAIVGGFGAALGAGSGEAARLRRELADRFRASRVVLTSGGTHALQSALERVPSGRGDRAVIAMPGYSCFDLVTAAVGAGVTIRFYDVEPDTLSPDLASLRRVVAEGVDAVVVGYLYGYPIDWQGISDTRAGHRFHVIEDAAQGVGAGPPEGPAGSMGDASVLSFGRGKGWTGGGGGALLLRALGDATEDGDTGGGAPAQHPDDRGLDRVAGSGLESGVSSLAAWLLGRPSLYGVPASIPSLRLGETVYHEPTPISGIRGFSAALARRTAEGALDAVEGRRRVAVELRRALHGAEDIRVPRPLGGDAHASFLRLPVLAPSPREAERIHAGGRSLGIERGYPIPLHRLPAAGPVLAADPGPLPGSTALTERLLTFPTHRWIGPREVEALARLAGGKG